MNFIDIIVIIFLVVAFIKGYRDGFIMSVFSVASYLAGFLAAVHFSFVIAAYLNESFKIGQQWLPIISFIILFLAVILLVRFIGKILEKTVNKLLPTIFNRLAGSALWMVIIVIICSMLFQFANSADVITKEAKQSSIAVPYLEITNNIIRNNIGEVIPFLNNLYEEIDDYFSEMADEISI